MKLYVVFKQGVYRHECGGVFSTPEAAGEVAKKLLEGEQDGYHTYEVVPFDLGVPTPQEDGYLQEPKAVLSLSRQ